ncbi:hypothetical protein GEV33_013082 [Tenebrio molitor]|uniref:Uncharacterized protein n=1 Tax=Tenebrio molitor TaxID=7067 RepID=A0A8J6L2Y6_TENMO|nr:hypothetical protein GEV33_013082 [Tenebrio molitor]
MDAAPLIGVGRTWSSQTPAERRRGPTEVRCDQAGLPGAPAGAVTGTALVQCEIWKNSCVACSAAINRFPESGAPTAPEPHREITVWDAGMDASRLIRKQSKRNIDKTMIYSRPPALPFHRGPLTASGATIQPHYIRRTSQLGFVLGYFGTARPEADRSGVEGREKRCEKNCIRSDRNSEIIGLPSNRRIVTRMYQTYLALSLLPVCTTNKRSVSDLAICTSVAPPLIHYGSILSISGIWKDRHRRRTRKSRAGDARLVKWDTCAGRYSERERKLALASTHRGNTFISIGVRVTTFTQAKWAVLKREFPDVMSRADKTARDGPSSVPCGHFKSSVRLYAASRGITAGPKTGTVVFCGGGEAAAVRAIGDHFRLVLHRFCSNNPAHNSSIDRKLRRSTPPLLKFEIRDAHLTDYNSTLTDKDCRVAAAGPPEPAAFCAFFADGWNKLLFERSTRALPTVSVPHCCGYGDDADPQFAAACAAFTVRLDLLTGAAKIGGARKINVIIARIFERKLTGVPGAFPE